MNIPIVERHSENGQLTLSFKGDWTIDFATECSEALKENNDGFDAIILDFGKINRLDTLGAWQLNKLVKDARQVQQDVSIKNISDANKAMFDRVASIEVTSEPLFVEKHWFLGLLEDIGLGMVNITYGFGQFLAFLGLVLARSFGGILEPKRIRLTPLVFQIDQVGFRALPIVGLISFLIGAVIVNQGAIQLAKFGADLFVIDMLAISILRELGILLTAIIIAGRSGSAFTAQIGSMKMREEIDAMQTIGMNPVDILVLPRLWALVIILPFLTFYSDFMGVLGGGLMAWVTLDISPTVFITRFKDAIELSTFLVGVIKAPFFAAVIAVSGCFEGMSVSGSAESVGVHTTRSVVQSIFLVIVLDALFAMFFTAIDF